MTIEQALAQAKLYTDGKRYLLVKLPASAIIPAASIIAELGEPFSTMIVDKDEVTLFIPADAWDVFAARLPGAIVSTIQYKLITFDIVLDLALVGFMARISRALAEAGVPIMVYAAYSRDHLLVPAEHFEMAWTVLEQLKR